MKVSIHVIKRSTGWIVRSYQSQRSIKVRLTREEAIERAKATGHKVYVHHEDGRVDFIIPATRPDTEKRQETKYTVRLTRDDEN